MIVFTGAGERAFCVGGDVREPTRTMAEKRAAHIDAPRLATPCATTASRSSAACAGYCIGGGNELNMISDLTISGTSGRFGQAGPRIGNALWWGSQLIPAVAGEKRGREVLFITRQYDAEEALRMGLVNAVVPDEELDAEVERWCAEILRRSPQGLRLAKMALNARTDALYSSDQPRDGADGPEPRLRPRAQGGHRLLPRAAAGRLAQFRGRPGARAGLTEGRAPWATGAIGTRTRTPRPGCWQTSCGAAPTSTLTARYLRYADGPWLSYGEVDARANRVANGLIARGVRPGESVSVLLPNCEEFVPVWYGILKAGAVMSPINTAYKGEFLSWTINLVESRVLVIADVYLDRLALVAGELPRLERVIVPETAPRGAGPEPSLPWEPLPALMEGPDTEPAGRHPLLDRRRPDHVHLGHHRPLQGA